MANDPDLTSSDECPIEHSPLQREVTRDGTTVRIWIYRGPDCSPNWLLEVEDQTGASTVWDEEFETDQHALDEALRTIDADGVKSVTEGQDPAAEARGFWQRVVAGEPIATLKRTLDRSRELMGFHATCGLVAAVATVPAMVPPSSWMSLIKGSHVFRDLAEVQAFTDAVMALYNAVLDSVAQEEAHCVPDPADHEAVREFCLGYLTIATSDATWKDDEDAFFETLPILALTGAAPMDLVGKFFPEAKKDPEGWLQDAREDLWVTLSGLYDFWAEARRTAAEEMAQRARPFRRDSAKVGRNEPCPCGSGKKFKKCCAH